MWRIVIPSYDKPEILKNNTLNMLRNQNVPSTKINIFLATPAEKKRYESIIPKDLYNKMIVGKKGLLTQLRFIKNYYPEGSELIRMDDDLKMVFKKKYSKKSFEDGKISRKQYNKIIKISLPSFFTKAFELLKKKNLTLWGINKVQNNPYFMTDGYSTDLRFIVGNIYGWINDYDKKYDWTLSSPLNYTNEDIEKTLKHYIADGGVLRFNDYGYTMVPNLSEGGIQSDIGLNNRMKLLKQSNKDLVKHYGYYGELAPNKLYGEMFRLYKNPHLVKGDGLDFSGDEYDSGDD
jgi:hypothetical protein